MKKDFKKASEIAQATAVDFAQLLDLCATKFPKTRFRFSTSNPQDMSLDVIHIMAKHKNICKYIRYISNNFINHYLYVYTIKTFQGV